MTYDGTVTADFSDALVGAMRVAAVRGQTVATRRVPVDTGALRGSIRIEETDDGFALIAGGGGHVNPSTGVPTEYYASVQERGHKTRHSYLKMGAQAIAAGFRSAYPREIRNAVRRSRYALGRARGQSASLARQFRERSIT